MTHMHSIENPDLELRTALEQWLENALQRIDENFDDFIQLIGMPRWHAMPDGSFKHFPYFPIYRHSEINGALFSNTECWNAVKSAAVTHKKFSIHINSMLNFGSGMRRRYSLSDLCQSLLPPTVLIGDKQVFANTDMSVSTAVEQFLKEVNSDTVTSKTVWPIRGLSTTIPIALDAQTEFRELSVKEKLSCLNFGIIAPDDQTEFEASNAKWFGLCYQNMEQKTFGDDLIDPTEFVKKYADLEQVLEDFMAVVPLAHNGAAYHAGGHHAAPHFSSGNLFAGSEVGRGIASNFFGFLFVDEASLISSAGAADLVSLWSFIRSNPGQEYKKRVANAVRRFFYAETRLKQEDSLVDLMIAAESLYLSSSHGELRFRLSLNASLWNGGENFHKKEVLASFKKAYDLRSSIVHGSSVPSGSVSDTIAKIKPVLRDGICKAIVSIQNSNAEPDWEEMIFQSQS